MINRRHVYVLLFAVPALLVSIIAAALMLAASAGALWLFVYGDDPWPNTANVLLEPSFFSSLQRCGWPCSLWRIRSDASRKVSCH
jgi:hypothetical protein